MSTARVKHDAGQDVGGRQALSSLLLLATDVYGGHGGIAAYMRRLVEVFSTHSTLTGTPFTCLSLSQVRDFSRSCLPLQGVTRFEVTARKSAFTYNAIRLAVDRRPTVAVVGHLGLAPVAWALKRIGLIRSYAVVLHGIEAWKKADLLDRIAARGATFVISTTEFTASEFATKNDVERERIRVVALGLEDGNIPQLVRKVRRGALNVLTVGRLVTSEAYKGVDTLIRAVAIARSQGLNVTLTIVGDGDDVPRLRGIKSELDMGTCVQFLGPISDSELQREYQKCDAFAMPSKCEGFGIVFLEAMRYGKPCIGGNHGGTPEVIDHGVNGFLVDHDDSPLIATYLRQLAEQPGIVECMGKNAQKAVENKYLYTHLEKRWLSLLEELLGA
jgi:phosphatidylinositol alpha-1,6-mannosyltransferase